MSTSCASHKCLATDSVNINKVGPANLLGHDVNALHIEIMKQVRNADLGRIENRLIQFFTVAESAILSGCGDAPQRNTATKFCKIPVSNHICLLHTFEEVNDMLSFGNVENGSQNIHSGIGHDAKEAKHEHPFFLITLFGFNTR